VLKSVEARGRLESANRLRATIGQVFRFAVATSRADMDPTAALRGAIASPVVQHRAAIIEPKAFGGLLRAIATYEGAPETKAALELMALTFVRPGELRTAEWSEFDLDAVVWSIAAEKMKMRRPHRVPLAPQALAILRPLRGISRGRFLFPSIRSQQRCMSENTINAALRRLGFSKDQMTGHGFRSAASSMLNESGLWSADAVERQLAHVDADSVRRAYARADYWEERVPPERHTAHIPAAICCSGFPRRQACVPVFLPRSCHCRRPVQETGTRYAGSPAPQDRAWH
jgi:integrase